jgi:flagellar motor component MotA
MIEELAFIATIIGFVKIMTALKNIYDRGDVRSYNMTSTILGIFTSLIWIVYDISKGLKMGAVVSSAALILDTYILHLLFKKDKIG